MLDASVSFYEVTRSGEATLTAVDLVTREFAARLKADPSARWEPLSPHCYVSPDARPWIDATLDHIQYRGPRRYPTESELYIWERDWHDLGGRLLRPWPDWIPRPRRIIVPYPQESSHATP